MQNVTESPEIHGCESPPPASAEHHRHHFGLALIAIFKLIKGILLLATAIGLFELIHSDLSATVEHWITVFRMDPDNRHFHWLLQKVGGISPADMKIASAGSFIYSALLLTEGIGLWFERRWAEYLTVIATSSFIPLELYELTKNVNNTKLVVMIINLSILWYLIRTLRRERKVKGR